MTAPMVPALMMITPADQGALIIHSLVWNISPRA
jgi:hypothetical protein